jgi:hypothetical protein
VKTLHDAADRDAILRRVAALRADTSRRWGTMSAGAMVAHLCASAQMALGELATQPKGVRAFQRFPIKHLVLYVLPIPKGAPTARELVVPDAGDFEAARSRLEALVARVAATPVDGQGPTHPLFGALTNKEWGVLAYKHMDHHLRQFGV